MIKHSAGVNGSVIEIFDPFVRLRSSKCAAAKVDRFHGGGTRTIKDPECFLSGRSFHTAPGVTAGRGKHTHHRHKTHTFKSTLHKHSHASFIRALRIIRQLIAEGKKEAKWSERKDGGRRVWIVMTREAPRADSHCD